MRSFLRGCLALLFLVVNTLFWCTPLFALALVRLLLPLPAVRRRVDPLLNAIAKAWISCNAVWAGPSPSFIYDVQGVESLRPGGWYIVSANHQSWVDIFVLQHVFNRRIPLLKFFLKQQLVWVPVIGLAWWALDFPFMRRHGKEALQRNPALRLQDRNSTRRACEKFALVPTSVMNFAEGTRFTPAKHRAQGSPYRHLLQPKAGALAMTLDALGGHFRALLDVTIAYPAGVPTFWQLLCGRVPLVRVRVREREIPPHFSGGTDENPMLRAEVQDWLRDMWTQKDDELVRLLQPASAGQDG